MVQCRETGGSSGGYGGRGDAGGGDGGFGGFGRDGGGCGPKKIGDFAFVAISLWNSRIHFTVPHLFLPPISLP